MHSFCRRNWEVNLKWKRPVQDVQAFFKLKIGLEPTTPSLRVKCSTNWAISALRFPKKLTAVYVITIFLKKQVIFYMLYQAFSIHHCSFSIVVFPWFSQNIMDEKLKIFLTRHLYNIIKLHTLTTNQRGGGLVSAIKTINKIQGGMFYQSKKR